MKIWHLEKIEHVESNIMNIVLGIDDIAPKYRFEQI